MGHFDLFNKKSGELIRAFTEAGDSLLVRNAGGETSDFNAALDASQKSAVGQAFTAYSLGQARIDRGDDPVGNPTGPNGAPPPPTPGAPRRGEIDGLQHHAGLIRSQPLIDLLPEVTFDPETGEQIFLLTSADRPPPLRGDVITGAPKQSVIEAGLPVTGSNPASDGASFTGALTSTGGQGGYTYEIVGSATGLYGTLQLNSDGTYTYTLITPIQDQGGNDGANAQVGAEVFTYRVTDANGNTATGQILINITDDVPVARADTIPVVEGGEVSGNVLTDGTPDAFGADGRTTPEGGVVGVRAAGNDLTDRSDWPRREADQRSVSASLPSTPTADIPTMALPMRCCPRRRDGRVRLHDPRRRRRSLDDDAHHQSHRFRPQGRNGQGRPSERSRTAHRQQSVEHRRHRCRQHAGRQRYGRDGELPVRNRRLGNGLLRHDQARAKRRVHLHADEGCDQHRRERRLGHRQLHVPRNGRERQHCDRPDRRQYRRRCARRACRHKSGTEGGEVTGNVLTDGTPDAFGADGAAAAAASSAFAPPSAAPHQRSDWPASEADQRTFGPLILNADGRYTYDGFANAVLPDGATDVFVYTIRDGDGDLVTTTLTINLTDSGLKAETDRDGQVSEAALPTGSNPSSTGVTDAINTLAGSVTGGTGTYLRNRRLGNGLYGTITLKQKASTPTH